MSKRLGKRPGPRPPEVYNVHGLVVHRTHDVELARQLVRDYARNLYGSSIWAYEPPAGIRTWLRVSICHCGEHAFHYAAGQPGQHGAFRAVEFPVSGNPIGTPAQVPS